MMFCYPEEKQPEQGKEPPLAFVASWLQSHCFGACSRRPPEQPPFAFAALPEQGESPSAKSKPPTAVLLPKSQLAGEGITFFYNIPSHNQRSLRTTTWQQRPGGQVEQEGASFFLL